MIDVEQILRNMAGVYRQKVDQGLSMTAQLDLHDLSESWRVVVRPGQTVEIQPVTENDPPADFIFTTPLETLQAIHSGELAPLTAMGKARASDPAPMELAFPDGVEQSPEGLSLALGFAQHFFNPTIPERIRFAEEHARIVHGGYAVPLYYDAGVRSAWYLLKPGMQANEPGDTNPFPQAFIIIAGHGRAQIGDQNIDIQAGESYLIPPGTDHIVWPGDGHALELIWLAWGEGA